ncbi:DUF6177 family protein [Streptomyces sp. NPDC021096]|uniref:DUF6177 family protein n=1 Tax=Streptomyces sp. NPDC021096 TaxID=3154792 RepID=UPI0033CDF0F1
MTKDVIALTERMPDTVSMLAGLLSGGPDLQVRTLGDGAVVQLCNAEGRPLVSIEAPMLLQVPGEAARLLGPDAEPASGTAWWIEARAATSVPQAEELAGAFAARLTMMLGGTIWPPDVPGTTDPAHPVDTSGITAVPAPAAAQPAVDMLTPRTAIVLQDRPVVPMTSWLSEALRAALESDRGLQIVTPGHCRISPALRSVLDAPTRWVVQDERCGYYDGTSGAVLRWEDGAFVPDRDESGETPVAESFADLRPTDERRLIVSFRTVHAPEADLVLGGALETVWRKLTGAPPAGWSTAEPVNVPWSRRQLTDLAYERAPRPTWTAVVGHPDRPAFATLRVIRTPKGVEEDVTLTLGYGPGEEVPLAELPALADELVTRYGLASLVCQLREAGRDLSVPPRLELPPVPVGFALGSEEVREVGRAHASRTPLREAPVRLGPASRPGYYYGLGDGEGPEGWEAMKTLMHYLRSGGEDFAGAAG